MVLFILQICAIKYLNIKEGMKLAVFNSFKKSLADSSRIVSDSRVSSSFNEMNVLETLQKHRPSSQSYIGRLSFDQSRGSNGDQSRIVKRVPELLSYNDELKDKVKRLEGQLNQFHSTHNNSVEDRRHTFSFRQSSYKKDQQCNNAEEYLAVQNSLEKQLSSIKTVQSSLGTVRQRITDKQPHSLAPNDNTVSISPDNQIEALKQRIKYLQIQNELLRKNNESVTERYAKTIETKFKHQQDIEEIVRSFEDTLRRKEELHVKQMNQVKQKIGPISQLLEDKVKQMEALKEQNERLKAKLQQKEYEVNNQMSLMQQIALLQSQLQNITFDLQQANKNYVVSQNVEHLWKIKQVQYENAREVIQSLLDLS